MRFNEKQNPTDIDLLNFSISIREKCIKLNRDFFNRYMSNDEYKKRKDEIMNNVLEYDFYAEKLNKTPFRIYRGIEKVDKSFQYVVN